MTPAWWAVATLGAVLGAWFLPELVFLVMLTVWFVCASVADVARWVWEWVRR